MKKIINVIFTSIFFMLIGLPLLFTNLRNGKVSESENRYLVSKPDFNLEDGSINTNIISEIEKWFDDNVGFRDRMVQAEALIQYYGFGNINRTDMYTGANGDLNYATEAMLKDYQHLNLRTKAQVEEIASAYQTIAQYLEEQGIAYYYMQCWDKHSIYPEQFMKGLMQYGKISKTDQIIEELQKTDIQLISLKEFLINAKDNYEVYSNWGDASHWTQRGAYIGYSEAMNVINKNYDNTYKVLSERDYNLTYTDQGSTLFNILHKEEYLENFAIKEPQAYETNEKLTLYASDSRHSFYTNDSVNNNTRLLIIGDSYLNGFILDDFRESFHEVIMIWGDYTADFVNIIEEYKPDIVLNECAERVDRFGAVVQLAEKIRN